MVLQNYIELQEGVPAKMHFTDHDIVPRGILDPDTKKPKSVTTLVFQVDELNGRPANATFSVVAEKLAAMLEPWLADSRYRQVDLIITRRGSGFMTAFSVEPSPRA